MAPEGRKIGLAKVAGAEPCGQMRDEKLHAVVARSRFPNVLEVVMSKKCTPLWRRISKSKSVKN